MILFFFFCPLLLLKILLFLDTLLFEIVFILFEFFYFKLIFIYNDNFLFKGFTRKRVFVWVYVCLCITKKGDLTGLWRTLLLTFDYMTVWMYKSVYFITEAAHVSSIKFCSISFHFIYCFLYYFCLPFTSLFCRYCYFSFILCDVVYFKDVVAASVDYKLMYRVYDPFSIFIVWLSCKYSKNIFNKKKKC